MPRLTLSIGSHGARRPRLRPNRRGARLPMTRSIATLSRDYASYVAIACAVTAWHAWHAASVAAGDNTTVAVAGNQPAAPAQSVAASPPGGAPHGAAPMDKQLTQLNKLQERAANGVPA